MKQFLFHNYKKVITIFCIVILSTITTKVMAANAKLDLTLSPSLLEVTTKPGGTATQSFRIRNNTDSPITLGLHVDKLDQSPLDGQVNPIPAQGNDTSPSWIHFDTTDVTARPREWTDVKFSINVPQDAAFGYYFAIHISQKASPDAPKKNATLLGEVVLPLLLTVDKAGAIKEAKLISFTTAKIHEYLPVIFTATLENTGNVHVKPRGNIFIRRGAKDIDVIQINAANGAILPGGKRIFTSDWSEGFLVREPVMEDGVAKKDASGKPVMHLVVNWDKLTSFRIGKYDAYMLMVYDNGQRDVPVEAITSFWVVPYTMIWIAVISILLFVLLIRFIIKFAVKREMRKYKQ